jgi:hypothetical protein
MKDIIDVFGAIFIISVVIILVIVIVGTITLTHKEMKEAVDFCGCSDKACVLVYMGSSFSKDDYDKQCK